MFRWDTFSSSYGSENTGHQKYCDRKRIKHDFILIVSVLKVRGGLSFCLFKLLLNNKSWGRKALWDKLLVFDLSLCSPVTWLASEIFSTIGPQTVLPLLSTWCMGIVNFASSHKDRISFDYSHGKPAITVLGNMKSPLYDTVYKRVKGHTLTCKLIEWWIWCGNWRLEQAKFFSLETSKHLLSLVYT